MFKRVINEASYLTNQKKTIREVASTFNVSKSTVHKDLKERLPIIDKNLSTKVDELLLKNFSTKHIRGGEKTRLKYQSLK